MSWPKNHVESKVTPQMRAQWHRQFDASDRAAGFEITDDFQPFSQINDMFNRSVWDPDVRSDDAAGFFQSYGSGAHPRRAAGFSQKDFALRNAAWSISDIISHRSAAKGDREGFGAAIIPDTLVNPNQLKLGDLRKETLEIKALARLFGADLVGVTEVDTRWHYASKVDVRDMSRAENTLPEGVTHVIIMGHAMDFDLVQTYPSALAGASTGREYSHEAAICIQLASYIRGLGYEAVASMNDTALVIPYAIKAGLGEYGRNQMVLTPEFGPRVRFSKIFTSLPLIADAPRQLGLATYCHSCTKCAEACPPKALPMGPPSLDVPNRSTITGVKKWSADCEKCFGYWAKLKTDCAICMRVCPFNRRYDRWQDHLWRWLALGIAPGLARFLEDRRGRNTQLKPKHWWASLTKKS